METLLHRIEQRLNPVFERTRGGRFLRDTVRALFGLLHGFRGEEVTTRAAALTFLCLFSLIPVLALGLSLLRLLKQNQIQLRVQQLAHDILAPGVREGTAAFLDRFLSIATSTAVSGVGAVFLLFSAGSLIHSLENSINAIWHVRRARVWYVRLGLYALVLFGGPVFLAISLTATSVARHLILGAHVQHASDLVWFGSVLVTIAAMTIFYVTAPATRVRFRSALAGGIVAGVAWEIAKHAYALFAERSFQVNPVYGSLGALPLFLLWIYVSWVIVLMGSRLAYAVQHATYRGVILDLERHPRARELIAARIAQLATEALLRGGKAPTSRSLARTLQVPDSTVNEIVELMTEAGVLVKVKGSALRPAKSPSELTLADVASAVGGIAGLLPRSADEFAKAPEFREVESFFQGLDETAVARLRTVTWASLVEETKPPEKRAPGAAEARSGNR